MKERRTLTGGKVLQWDHTDVQFTPNADRPHLKVSAPGRVTISSGAYRQLDRVHEELGSNPDPQYVEMVIRQVADGTYFLLIPTNENNPRARRIRFSSLGTTKSVYHLKQFFADSGIELKVGLSYWVGTEIVKDEQFGSCVAAHWTTAKARGRRRKQVASSSAPVPTT